MGLESRDYIRDGSYTSRLTGLGIEFTPVVKYLIIANVVVFLLQIFITRTERPKFPENIQEEIERQHPGATEADREKMEKAMQEAKRQMERMMSHLPGMRVSVVQEWFELDPEKTVKQGQVWRLVTCAFCHARHMLWHILLNMLFLYWFGTRLEAMYGSREFLLFYLTAAVCSSAAYLALAFYTDSTAPAIGASGAVMGVMMLYTIFYPQETFLLFFVIPVPLWALLGVYVLFDLHPVLLALSGDKLFTTVAHAGHLGGLLFGFLYWRLGLRLEAPLDWISRRPGRPVVRKARPRPEPASPPPVQRDALDDQVDEVLRKISEQGKESLTDEERDVLVRASAKYRSGK